MNELNTLVDSACRKAAKRQYREAACDMEAAIDHAPLLFLPIIEETRAKYVDLHDKQQKADAWAAFWRRFQWRAKTEEKVGK